MMPALMASALAMSCRSDRTISFLAETEVRAGPVALGSVADLSVLPKALRPRAAALAVASLPAGRQTLPVGLLRARARGLMPVLGCWLPRDSGAATIRLRVAPAPSAAAPAATAALPWRQPAAVRRGDHLRLATTAGPVRVERDVEALQAARNGQRLFVRAADGKTLSVVYQAPTP